jgi:hypothetical protein
VAVWPTVTVWLTGCAEIEGVTGTPAAVIAMVAISLATTGGKGPLAVLARRVVDVLLVIKRFPETLLIAAGAKVIVKVAFCPPANVNGSVGPLRVKTPPDVAVWTRVTASVPEFVRVRLCLLLEPITTFPKFSVVGLIVRLPGDWAHPDNVRAINNTVGRNRKKGR